jgi:hypothetical protein
MTLLNENFVTDSKGKKIAVLLPIKDYNKILEELEELEDIKAYDKAMNRKQKFIPLKQAVKKNEAAGDTTKKQILQNIKTGLDEVQLFKKGKLKTTPAKDFLNEL